MENEQNPKKVNNGQKIAKIALLDAGVEFAFLIGVPLIGAILLGKWLNNRYNQKYFIIITILLALAITCVSIYRRIKDYKKLMDKDNK